MRSPQIILASGSSARRALLAGAGLRFRVTPTAVDEAAAKAAARAQGSDGGETALRLATLKARSLDAPGALIIGADQLLVCEGAWFDKPADLAAARTHLLALRARAHVLETACVLMRDGEALWSTVSRPRLVMRAFSDAFLEAYLAAEGESLLGCVGAYRMEGLGVQLFEQVDGEHAAILGLPLLGLLAALRQAGAIEV